jgi:hypothetical protein
VALLLGASLPLLVSTAILLFFEAISAAVARIVPLDEFPIANNALLMLAAVIPALAAITVTAYALSNVIYAHRESRPPDASPHRPPVASGNP